MGLSAVTGVCADEPLGLDRDDLDLSTGVVTVGKAKFGTSRHIPVHSSTQQAVARYGARRDCPCPHPLSAGSILSERGPGSPTAHCVGPSLGSANRPTCGAIPVPAALACTICAIASLSARCCAGVATGSMSSAASPPWQPTSGTRTCTAPKGRSPHDQATEDAFRRVRADGQ